LLVDPTPVSPALRERIGHDYVVVHPGTSSVMKEWPVQRWRALVCQLLAEGRTVICTGAGSRETAIVAEICANLEGVIDLCGQLNWQEFVSVIADASLYLGVDSVGAHIASAFSTPSVTVSAGTNHRALWHPMSQTAQVLSSTVSCAPCYRSRGCHSMTCVKEVSITEMREATRTAATFPD
jgi:ADP-heptose:LPS heptosyltransferase